MIRRIAVIGATGMLGQPVTHALHAAGFEVTALVRNIGEARKHLPSAIKLVKGDLSNKADVDLLLNNKEAVYLNLSTRPEERLRDFHTESEGLNNVVDAAKKFGLKRIGYLSALVLRYQGMNDFNWWVFDVKRKAADIVRESGIPYTLFYPSTFMEALDHQFKAGSFMMLAGSSAQKMYFIAAADYARQVVRSFELLKAGNKEYVVQGPQGYTIDEAVDIFAMHYKKQRLFISRVPIRMLKILARFSQKMNYGYHIMEAMNKYPEQFEAAKTWEELGKPSILLKEYASRL